jgi:hypothetical protein
MRWSPLAVVAALALAAACSAGPASAAKMQTFVLPGAGISLQLPAGWRKEKTPPGWRFLAKSGSGATVASVYVNKFPAAMEGNAFHKNVLVFERSFARKSDPHARITTRASQVAGEPALEIVAHYGPLTAYLFAFEHADRDYVLEYVADAPSLRAAKPVFYGSRRSVRFLAVP